MENENKNLNERLKKYCNENGYKIKYIKEKALSEYLDKLDKLK